MTDQPYDRPLPIPKAARVWMEAIRTATSVLALVANLTALGILLTR